MILNRDFGVCAIYGNTCHPAIAISVVPGLGTTQVFEFLIFDIVPVLSGRRTDGQDRDVRPDHTTP